MQPAKKKKNKPSGPSTHQRIPEVVQIVEYTIYDEPFEAPIEGISDADAEEIDALTRKMLSGKTRARIALIPELEALVARFPQVPQLHNNLAAALVLAGRVDDAEAMVCRTIDRFPDNLTAKLQYAGLLLDSGRADRILPTFNHQIGMHHLAGGRTEFHTSEVVNYFRFMVMYHLRLGDVGRAMDSVVMLEDLVPNAPTVDLLNVIMLHQMETKGERLWGKPAKKRRT